MADLPVILVVDADAEALERTGAELRGRYERDYRIVCDRSPDSAVPTLEGLHEAGGDLALVLADLACTVLLGRVQELYPRAKRGLLIAWGEWGDEDTATAIRDAMALGRIDYYLLKPWTSPDEYLHRMVCELLLEWRRADPAAQREVTVVSDPQAGRTHEIRNLLARSGVPHAFHRHESSEGKRLLHERGRAGSSVPVVILLDGTVLVDPSNTELARGYRVPTELERFEFDVVVVGAGPAGLAAAVYASSEGLEALVVERGSIGGQAGWSSRIRNYLGFPRGVSGAELAQRAYQQAWVFGTNFLLTKEVTRLRIGEREHVVTISDGTEVRAASVILAMGIEYRRLETPALARFENRGVYYGTSPADAPEFAGAHVVVVGGGNSAGQAAIHLSRYAERVTIVCRRNELTCSAYLQEEIGARVNISLRLSTLVVDAAGDQRLERLTLRRETGEETVDADALFSLIGARPRTEWLPDEFARDERGYVLTDEDLGASWKEDRSPFMFETSVPGVFAVGDVRASPVKRVAAAAGEGSVVIPQVHRYLAAGERAATADRR